MAEILASHAGGTGSPTKTAARVADAIAARGDDGTWLSTVPRAELLASAEAIEKRPGARTLPLYGVPFGVKDSIDVEGDVDHGVPAGEMIAESQVGARLHAAGTSAADVGMEALNGAGVVYEGLKTLGEGAVLVGLILGAMVTFILEKKFVYAALASAVGGVLSFVGLIHAPEVAWAANPQVALGYVLFGTVCAACGLLPGAREPMLVDESDVVAGH